MIHRKHFIWLAGLMVTALLILAGCGQGKAEYTVTASGDSVQEGVITVLDYSINVYKDEASNSCGDCENVQMISGRSFHAMVRLSCCVKRRQAQWRA